MRRSCKPPAGPKRIRPAGTKRLRGRPNPPLIAPKKLIPAKDCCRRVLVNDNYCWQFISPCAF
jgi:hypothetical protein